MILLTDVYMRGPTYCAYLIYMFNAFAVLSKSAADRSDLVETHKMGRVSLGLNIAGIIITMIIVIIVVGIMVVFVALFGAIGKGIDESFTRGFGNNDTSS